jgi:hypothetical protein
MKKWKFSRKKIAVSLSIIAYLVIAFLSQDWRFIPFTFFLLFVILAGIGISDDSDVYFPSGDSSNADTYDTSGNNDDYDNSGNEDNNDSESSDGKE